MKLSEFVDNLESKGRCCFLKTEARDAIGSSEIALYESIRRLIHKKRLSLIRGNFFAIIPVTFKHKGIIPADWFIHPFMQSQELPYYVSLLTAANYYGAAHQKPQVFQVITKKKMRKITKNGLRIEFYSNRNIDASLIRDFQASRGNIKIASPELLAFDLVEYYYACGYFSNIATVFSELKESIDSEKLFQIAISNKYTKAIVQRLGYLMSLDDVGGASIVLKIKEYIKSKKPRFVPLQVGQAYLKMPKDQDWRIWINEEVEVDI